MRVQICRQEEMPEERVAAQRNRQEETPGEQAAAVQRSHREVIQAAV